MIVSLRCFEYLRDTIFLMNSTAGLAYFEMNELESLTLNKLLILYSFGVVIKDDSYKKSLCIYKCVALYSKGSTICPKILGI
jgi:hypothetical protein